MESGSLGGWAGSRVPPRPPPPPPLVGIRTAKALLHQGPESRPERANGALERRVPCAGFNCGAGVFIAISACCVVSGDVS